ncbi:MAG: histidine kinase [Mobilitalea sp.]
MKLNEKISNKRNQISLKTQLTTLITTTITVIIIIIVIFNYQRNKDTIMSQQISTSTTLLNLELQNINTYFSEIDHYSLLLRNDENALQCFTTMKPLTYSEVTYVQSVLKSNFYFRNDLLSYRLYLLNQTANYEITSEKQMVKVFYDDSLKSLKSYNSFTTGKYYKYIQPAEEENAFIIYYRTIINIEDQRPLAVVKLILDTSFMDSLAENHDNASEILCMIDNNGSLLYSTDEGITTPDVCRKLKNKMGAISDNNFIAEFGGVKYLAIYDTSEKHDYSVIILNSLTLIDYQVTQTRNISFILGLLSILIAAALAITFIGFITNPLSKLSHRLQNVGKGNFSTTTSIGGSVEIDHLAKSFNDMIYQIDELINKNYISELNEKTARLIALEAQINPHFLYNTLQAISAEALVNNQPQINSMVTSLASMLRYSIKGGDLVMLKEEVKHVQDYLLLQHARFEDALTYDIVIDEQVENLMIPKISIQILVENSIIHGMSGDRTSIHLHIESTVVDEALVITVSDNGIGFTEEQRIKIVAFLQEDISSKSRESYIGLSNLYNRLKILYGEKAQLLIESIPGEQSTVRIIIPIIMEGENV